jgi:hypothetical protein
MEIGLVAGRFREVAMFVHEIPELGRNGRAQQHGDIMSDQIVERGKLWSSRIRRAHEEDPLVVRQWLAGEMTKALPLFIAEGGKDGVAFPPEDQFRGADPGQFLEKHFLAHTVEDVPEDLGAETRRFDV